MAFAPFEERLGDKAHETEGGIPMRKMSVLAAGGLVACLAAGVGGAHAQPPREAAAGPGVRVNRVSTLLHAKVQLREGSYGTVEDVVLNDDGCVEWLVLSAEDEYAVVPWQAARVDFAQRVVRVDVPRERIREFRFTRDHWPDFRDARFTDRIYRVYNVEGRRGHDVERREGVPGDRRDIREDRRDIRRDERDIRRDERDQGRDNRREPATPDRRSPEDRNAPRRTPEPPPPTPRPPQP
jgi:hypothetical protein